MRSRTIVFAVVCLASGACATGDPGNEWWTGNPVDAGGGDVKVDTGSGHHDAAMVTQDASDDPISSDGDDGGSGFDSETPDMGSACMLKMSYGTPMCDTCMTQLCCTEDNTCANDPNCIALLNCISACGPPPPDGGTSCLDGCANQYPSAMPEYMAVGNCFIGSCRAQCGP
jgi:hypothetical protein